MTESGQDSGRDDSSGRIRLAFGILGRHATRHMSFMSVDRSWDFRRSVLSFATGLSVITRNSWALWLYSPVHR